VLSERKTLTEDQRPVQIEDPDFARPLEAIEPHLPHDHHRWTFPVEVALAVVLTVPGPSTLVEAEIAARNRPPRPRTRRSAVTFPVGRPLPSSVPNRCRHMHGGVHLALWTATDGGDRRAHDPCLRPAAQRGERRARGGRPLSATASATGGVAGC
jgi:hypothetical protein